MFHKITQSEMCNTQTGARPLRKAIRKNQQPQKKFNIRVTLKSFFLLLLVVATSFGAYKTVSYIGSLKTQVSVLTHQQQEHIKLQAENTAKVAFFESALRKTVITPYIPQLGGINGGGKCYANGEPVISIAASRKALKTGSVAMGDYVLLVGQIKDTKGEVIKDHSFDIQVPSMDVAKIIAKRPFNYVNLSKGDSPYKGLLPRKPNS